ncbi:MAG: Glycosyl hydrolase, BNR repeat precursor [Candidatus Saccharicenans subterraneus]|uniref:Glycosyl hydrolase, BNR repeat n=1 Tax=Candidatus Saccharicenans subterraneus TaxID=2508984 RepID=A0A3E2BMS1_9BACT|nr:MAG: Glycosyl hydrolase, BNR repeat precursor [Candidatus Saccharicenans subterraneum]
MNLKRTLICLMSAFILTGSLTSAAQTAKEKTGAAVRLNESLFQAVKYRSIGPTRQSGRFVDFAVPRQKPFTFYAATASGGLWKTVNNGLTFEPIFDHERVVSIGDIEVAPSSPEVIWVGTGEANNSRSTYWGDGVYKSTDGGKTWKNMGLKDTHHIGRILIDPVNPDVVYVAALGHLYSENDDRGLYKTTDGGKTWQRVLEVRVENRAVGVVDVVMDPENSSVLYAAAYDRLRKPWNYQLGGPGSGIYKTTDGGRTWKKLENGLPGGILGRIGLAVYLRNPRIVYACIENANKPGMSPEDRYREIVLGLPSAGMIDGEVYRSDDGGESWRKISPEGQSIGGAPGYYYGQIVVDPNDDKVVYVLSVSVLGTRDAGRTWNRRVFNFGGDNHALWINPENSNHMLLGYDHGMGVTYDGGKTWYHPDFLPLAQFYAVGLDNSYPYRVAGGTQDNGSHLGPSTRPGGKPVRLEHWATVGGGDGMYNVFDWKTNRYLYNESQFGAIQRIDLQTGERKSIRYQREDLRWNWCAPIMVSRHNSDVIYHAANILLKSPYRGEYWVEVSPDLTTNDKEKLPQGKGGDGNIQYCTITTIDESPLVEGLLWVGTDDGQVWVTRDGGKNWEKLTDKIKGHPGYWVSRVVASNFSPGTAYLTVTGFRQDDFRPYIFKTDDYGQTWVPIVGNLAEGPVNVIREDHRNPQLLIAGTDFGVYATLDGGKNWFNLKGNMPTQPVHDLIIHPRDNDLVVATHGRGIFITDISWLQELTPEILNRELHLFSVEPKIRWIDKDMGHSSSLNYEGESEPEAAVINYYLKSEVGGEVKVRIYQGQMLINELKGSSGAGFNQVLWNLTARRERTPEEKKRFEQMMTRMASAGYRSQVDPNYVYSPVREGEYRVVVEAGGQQVSGVIRILPDLWN